MRRIRRIDFDDVAWHDGGDGVRSKSVDRDGRRFRLVEFAPGTSESEWCERGHVGCVLSGRLAIEFSDTTEAYAEDDAILIESGDRHRARVVEGPVRLFLLEAPPERGSIADTSSARNVELVRRFYQEMWNRFDTSMLPDILTDDVEFRGSLGRVTRGHAEFREYVSTIQRAFPDFHNRVDDLVDDGNRSFARLTYTGIHRGEILGIAPTGRPVEYAGAALFTFRDDRIASVWVLGDVHGLLVQLGTMPAS